MNIEDYQDVFEPFGKLIRVEICGEAREVPENNTLLRCFQFLSPETVSYGNFCWNGDCLNCCVWIEDENREKTLLSCRVKIEQKMKIVRISEEIKKVLKGK